MGNSPSSTGQTQQHHASADPASIGDAAISSTATGSSVERNGFGAQQHASRRYSPGDTSRILVDVRGANLQHDYNIFIKADPNRDGSSEHGLRALSNQIQLVGGALITILTVHKLFEEILFMRKLRRELGRIAGSLGDNENQGLDAGPGMRNLSLNQVGGELASPPSNNTIDTTWDSISGLTEVKMLLQEATVLPTLRPDLFQGIRQPPKGILLFGPPGTGKTMLARAVAAESRASFFTVTGSSILSMWYGQSEQNVKALFEKARSSQPSVIFIDEVESLLSKRSGAGRDSMPDKRVTNEFLAFLDGIQTGRQDNRIVVIAATNNPWDLDEAALSRFARRIYVPLPDRTTRASLLRSAMRSVACAIDEAQWLVIADKCDKYSGRDLVHVCREASMRPLRELWGKRLLESSPQTATHTKLVNLVASSLGKCSNSRKKVQRQLEKWKRKHRADWCNTDAIMQQAEHYLAARSRAEQPHGQGQATVPGEPAVAPTGAGAAQSGGVARCGSQSGGNVVGTQVPLVGPGGAKVGLVKHQACTAAGRGQPPKGGQSAQTQASSACSSVQTLSAAVSHSDLAGANSALQAHACSNLPADATPAASSAGAGVSCACATACNRGTSSNGSGGGAACQPATSSCSQGQTLLDKFNAPPQPETDSAAGCSSSTAASSTAGGGDANSGGMQQAAGLPDSGAAAAAAASSAAPAATAAQASTPKSGAAGQAWSVDDLLGLPASKVRPVTSDDFAAALKQMNNSEFDLSARFEEWNEMYGSGADVKGSGRNRVWQSMYA